MVDELLQVRVMGLRRQALASNPLDLVPLVGALVVGHLELGQEVPVLGEEVLSLLVHVPVHDVDEGRGSLEVLEVDVLQDPGVDDDVILDVVIRHVDASIPDFPLCHRHSVIVHFFLGELDNLAFQTFNIYIPYFFKGREEER